MQDEAALQKEQLLTTGRDAAATAIMKGQSPEEASAAAVEAVVKAGASTEHAAMVAGEAAGAAVTAAGGNWKEAAKAAVRAAQQLAQAGCITRERRRHARAKAAYPPSEPGASSERARGP